MSLRALVQQKKAAARLDHPLASYSSSGKLSCLACSIPIKHDALFAAHLASKQHRINAQARAQGQAQAKRAREQEAAAATLAPVDYEGSSDEDDGDDGERERKRQRTDGPEVSSSLPADFFADPSQAPAPSAPSRSPSPTAPAAPVEEEDDDWLAFERDVLGPSTSKIASTAPATLNSAGVTITAEPVLYGETEEDKPAGEAEEADDGPPPETDAERVARLDLEEREELMSRIEECVGASLSHSAAAEDHHREEREQLEADERVEAMKRRLAAVREAKATIPEAQQPVKLDLKGSRAKKRAAAAPS
jgi:zinc finger protein 830